MDPSPVYYVDVARGHPSAACSVVEAHRGSYGIYVVVVALAHRSRLGFDEIDVEQNRLRMGLSFVVSSLAETDPYLRKDPFLDRGSLVDYRPLSLTSGVLHQLQAHRCDLRLSGEVEYQDPLISSPSTNVRYHGDACEEVLPHLHPHTYPALPVLT